MKSHLCLEKPLQQEIWQGLTLLQYLLTQQEMEFLVTNLQCINAKECDMDQAKVSLVKEL